MSAKHLPPEKGTVSDYTKVLLDFLKLAPRYLITISLIAGFCLFAPDAWLRHLRINDFAKHNGEWLGIVFVVSSLLFIVDRTIAIAGWIRDQASLKKISQLRLQRLHALTEEEKQILRFYIIKQTKTNYLRIEDGVVNGLVAAGIIYLASSTGSWLEGFAHNISDFAWDYLNKNQTLLLGTTKLYRTERREEFQ